MLAALAYAAMREFALSAVRGSSGLPKETLVLQEGAGPPFSVKSIAG